MKVSACVITVAVPLCIGALPPCAFAQPTFNVEDRFPSSGVSGPPPACTYNITAGVPVSESRSCSAAAPNAINASSSETHADRGSLSASVMQSHRVVCVCTNGDGNRGSANFTVNDLVISGPPGNVVVGYRLDATGSVSVTRGAFNASATLAVTSSGVSIPNLLQRTTDGTDALSTRVTFNRTHNANTIINWAATAIASVTLVGVAAPPPSASANITVRLPLPPETVFALPPGYTANCPSLDIVNNLWMGGVTCDSIDFNADGLFPDTADIDDFLSVFSGGPCSTGTCGDIDFNNDGLFPDTTDIDSLLSVFSGGACL